MTDAEIIIALGDVSLTAQAIGSPKSTVANWKARGIPWHKRATIRDLARKRRVKLPADFLHVQKPFSAYDPKDVE